MYVSKYLMEYGVNSEEKEELNKAPALLSSFVRSLFTPIHACIMIMASKEKKKKNLYFFSSSSSSRLLAGKKEMHGRNRSVRKDHGQEQECDIFS